MIYVDCERALEVYTLEEILEMNDVSELEVLSFLFGEGFIKLPEIRPL